MPRADVLTLVTLIGGTAAQSPQTINYYADTVKDLGQTPIFCVATLIPTVEGTAEYQLPATAVELMGGFYDDRLLSLSSLRELEAADPDWRDARGSPVAYNINQVNKNAIRLYPAPDANSNAQIFSHGAPFGLDYPPGTAAFIHTETRQDLPTWIDLPLAFAVMALEFGRDSDHKDPAFASVCEQVGGLLMSMVVGDVMSD